MSDTPPQNNAPMDNGLIPTDVAERPFVYAPPATPVRVIHKDDHLLVLAKPSGLLSVPGRPEEHFDSLKTRVLKDYPDATIVHRLDMDTSGFIVMACTRAAHRHLGLQFEKRKLRKSYIARVWGTPAEDEGRIIAPMRFDWPNRPKQMIDFEEGREAITDWEVMEREEGITRLRLKPHTGRSHQLRVHLMSIGHPILGDTLYAHDDALHAANRLQLHSETLRLRHPKDGSWVTFTDPCPF